MGKTFAENLLQDSDNDDVIGAGLSIFHGQQKSKQKKVEKTQEDDWDSDMEIIFGNK